MIIGSHISSEINKGKFKNLINQKIKINDSSNTYSLLSNGSFKK